MNIKCYPLPQTRDPFINTPFVRAGEDPETGEERFWTGSWNANTGMTGVLVTPSGKCRVYHFEKGFGLAGSGAYSAAYAGDDTMWLVSDTAALRRLDLRSGAVEEFRTGVEIGLVFACMPYDPGTGKFLFLANLSGSVTGVCFDTRACRTHKVYRDFTVCTGVRGGFPNGDGTYTIRFVESEHALWRWDPQTDELVRAQRIPAYDKWLLLHSISDGPRHYVPYAGWFDGYTLTPCTPPEREMQWFGRCGDTAFGLELSGDAIWSWEMDTGKVRQLCRCPDVTTAVMTREGDILALTLYGFLYRFGTDGTLRLSRRLDTDSWGAVDCMIAGDDGVIVGTPFITQRFWVFDEKTGAGYDAGRAAPGIGEVLQTWYRDKKFYLCAYNQAYLMEYDPTLPACYPENPRIVAKAPHGLRPVAAAEDRDSLYFASNHPYGTLGCVLTRYDLRTGVSRSLDDPLPAHAIRSLYRTEDALWSGTTWTSDARSARETARDCALVRHDPVTLEPLSACAAPEGTDSVLIPGETEGGLMVCFTGRDTRLAFFRFDTGAFEALLPAPDGFRKPLRTGRPDEYLLLRRGAVERWRIRPGEAECLETILADEGIYAIFLSHTADGPVLMAARQKDFFVIRGI